MGHRKKLGFSCQLLEADKNMIFQNSTNFEISDFFAAPWPNYKNYTCSLWSDWFDNSMAYITDTIYQIHSNLDWKWSTIYLTWYTSKVFFKNYSIKIIQFLKVMRNFWSSCCRIKRFRIKLNFWAEHIIWDDSG